MEGVEGGLITGGGTADMTMKYLSFLCLFLIECGMLKQVNCYKVLILKVKCVQLFGRNMKKKLSHLMGSVKIN